MSAKPTDVTQAADGFFYRTQDGTTFRVCEDCWQPIPRYVDFAQGLTSPESDGDTGGNFAKRRHTAVEGKAAVEALRKAVCLPCYRAAFRRVYPSAPFPKLSDAVLAASQPYVSAPDAPLEHAEAPRVA